MPISVINIDISKYIKHINIKYTSLKYFRMIFPYSGKAITKKIFEGSNSNGNIQIHKLWSQKLFDYLCW